jgi:hypothetical protein
LEAVPDTLRDGDGTGDGVLFVSFELNHVLNSLSAPLASALHAGLQRRNILGDILGSNRVRVVIRLARRCIRQST